MDNTVDRARFRNFLYHIKWVIYLNDDVTVKTLTARGERKTGGKEKK